jgi:type VI protein secretion system component Hcp
MDIVVELDFDNGPFVVINAESFSWGVTLGGNGGSPQPPSASQDLVFTAASSADSTPQLKSGCESGSPLRRVTLSAIDPNAGTGLKWILDTAFLSSFQTSGDTSQTFTFDSVSVNFLTSVVEPV